MFARTSHASLSPWSLSRSFDMQSLEARRLMAADLVVQSIDVTDGLHTSTSETSTATFVVKNIGTTAAPAGARLRMRFSVDDVWGNADDLILNYKTMPNGLAAGETWTYTTSQRASAQPTGSFRFLAYIDGFNDVAESNENNNVLASAAGTVVYANQELAGTDILGTLGNDVIELTASSDMAFVTVNGVSKYKSLAGVTQFFVDAAAGNDKVIASPDFPVRLAVTGGGGNDMIIGGAGNDELSGANGKDKVFGGAGNDYCLGGAAADRLYGEDGVNTLSGAGGNDYLFAGPDGGNYLLGGAGNDRLFAKGNSANTDTLSGNTGNDTAEADAADLLAGIEATV
ncbi:MAG: CARDB domain-containing protein [Tepidisphaeraceae bacterium]